MTHTVIQTDQPLYPYSVVREDGAIVCMATSAEYADAAAGSLDGKEPLLTLSVLEIYSIAPSLNEEPQALFTLGVQPDSPLIVCYHYSDACRIIQPLLK